MLDYKKCELGVRTFKQDRITIGSALKWRTLALTYPLGVGVPLRFLTIATKCNTKCKEM